MCDIVRVAGGPVGNQLDGAIPEADIEIQRLIDSQIGSHKIGSTIAEEALRRSSTDLSPDLPADLLQDAVFNQQVIEFFLFIFCFFFFDDFFNQL